MAQKNSERGKLMKTTRKKLWIAVRSQRGLITDAEIHLTRKAAAARERLWKESLNRDYDETAVIAGVLPQ
jgi:hypothetical protein